MSFFVCFGVCFGFLFFNTVLENSKQNKETASSGVVSEKGRVVQLAWDLQGGGDQKKVQSHKV